MKITKIWSMPNKQTFQIKPIHSLLKKYILPKQVVVDPFAGGNSEFATISNDLNPEFDTDYHLDALDFLKSLHSKSADVVLYDPPYSVRQASELL